MLAHAKNAKTATIPGAAHPMFRQQPQLFSKAVLGFLAG
jgi:pimeloyl-ACP methyl ester carboxylesterase